jgi:uncharacterized protein YneF (UPF0154 family)
MTVIEITLIIISIIFLIGSFFVQEKLSQKDIDQITRMSEAQLRVIVENQLKGADSKVEEMIGVEVEEQIATIRRAMEKLSNEKIMAINEYSDTVLESMNKTHNEIMFLYSMLNDKHKELTDLAGQLDEIPRQIHGQEKEAMERLNAQISVVEQKVKEAAPLQEKELLEAAASNNAAGNNAAGSTASGGTAAGSTASKKRATSSLVEKNHNDDILFLHDAGKTDVEIAKDLGLGLGEVKLVIGLFKEGN